MDTLFIKALRVNTQIGVYAWEQRIRQDLFIDIHLATDFSRCEDILDNTIDYAALCALITDYVESKTFQLIETVANEVYALIQERFAVHSLSVRVTKPRAVANAEALQVQKGNCSHPM